MKLSIQPLSQRDARWKDQRLGTKTGTTIGSDGCVITSASMMYTYYGKTTTPDQLDNYLTDNGLYYDQNLWVPGSVGRWMQGVKYDRMIDCTNIPAPINEIRAYLDQGKPVFVWVINEGVKHCVLAIGYEGNEIIVNDPWRGDTVAVNARWGSSAEKIIEVDFYTGTPPAQVSQICIDTKLYEHLVDGASVRKDTATYLEVGDPDHAPFDKIKAVIAGYKSSVTEAQNKANEANTKLAVANQEVANLQDKVANVIAECQKSYTLLETEYKALIEKSKIDESLKGQYQGTIDEQQGTIRELQKTVGQKELTITELNARVEALSKSQAKSYKLGELLNLIWIKVKTLDIKL